MHSGGDGVCLEERDRGRHEVVLGDVGTAGDNGGVLAVWGRWMLGRVTIGDVGFCLDSWLSFFC